MGKIVTIPHNLIFSITYGVNLMNNFKAMDFLTFF